MVGILVYGSLMNRREAKAQQLAGRTMLPVLVDGYRRQFSQEPSWRSASGRERAVLSVMPARNHAMNGILLQGISSKHLHLLDKREQGYERVMVASESVRHWTQGKNTISCATIFIYQGKSEKSNSELLPHPAYLQLCLDGAREWGPDFFAQFLHTTFVGSQLLSEYLRCRDLYLS